jgi:glycosyltransferase involved in cell wall biosynthesis
LKKVSNIRLSICIATRNRGNFIGATLESVICQATEQVEIIVLDGGSTDNTREVVRKHQAGFTGLHYSPQNVNGGVDQDFAKAVDVAQGDYCWLFSDDDLLKPRAIQAVLDAIDNRYGLIISNAEVRNADLSKVLEPQKLTLSADRIYKSNEDHILLADVGSYLSFIGCVIIKRELWYAREREKYFGSLFVHVGVIFQSPLLEDTLVIAKPLISIRYGNAVWLHRYFEIWMFKWPDLIWSFTHIPDRVKLKLSLRDPWRRPLNLFFQRAKGTYTIDTYRKWLQPRLNFFWDRLKSKAIAYLPGRIANLLSVFYFSTLCRRPGTRLELLDFRNSPFFYRKLGKSAGSTEQKAVTALSRELRSDSL